MRAETQDMGTAADLIVGDGFPVLREATPPLQYDRTNTRYSPFNTSHGIPRIPLPTPNMPLGIFGATFPPGEGMRPAAAVAPKGRQFPKPNSTIN